MDEWGPNFSEKCKSSVLQNFFLEEQCKHFSFSFRRQMNADSGFAPLFCVSIRQFSVHCMKKDLPVIEVGSVKV